MKRRVLILALALAALGAALAAPSAQASFGLNAFDVGFEEENGTTPLLAGSHPYQMTTSFGVNYSGAGKAALPDGEVKDLTVTPPAGFIANPRAVPRCSTALFLQAATSTTISCPPESMVGQVRVNVNEPEVTETARVYNLQAPPGAPARLGFAVLGVPLVIDGKVSERPPYGVVAELRDVRQTLKVYGSKLTLWGLPADPSHDAARGAPVSVEDPEPFLTLPGSCTGPAATEYEALSWEGASDSGSVLTHVGGGGPQGFGGCDSLPFAPTIGSQPTSEDAESASGLRFDLHFDQQGLLNPTGRAQSTMKKIVVALPRGLTADPSLAEGLGTCSESQLAAERVDGAPGAGCPQSSKLGTLEVRTPLLESPLPGTVYLATPENPDTAAQENPFGSLIALYLVFKDPGLGVLIKLPAKVELREGQLITTLDDLPHLPFTEASFRFREGQRAPLITPASCGTYTTEATLTPWASPSTAVQASSSFQVRHGVGGGACPPGGVPPFEPGFQAGSLNNAAAAHSPYEMRITRPDGSQDLTRLAATLPRGVLARIAGVDRCPEAQIALAKSRSAGAELASPSCPANSKIGSTLAAAGVGEALTYVPGSLYLAGPFNGAPLSVVAITPAKAGPFDVGTVVVREALRVDPRSAEVSVDPSASDPIPHMLEGIPLKLRELRVSVDRPGFALNPTSCDRSATEATLWGGFLNLLDPSAPSPETTVARSARYQAADCARLGFSPRLALRLRGAVRRGGFPALHATYRPRAGQANLRRLALRFPHSEFIEQGHFRTICTRVQFAAGPGHGARCPSGSVYGHAKVFTPLLDEPLKGPVFLRSSDHNLPDAVFALHGIVDLEVVVRIDSRHGGLRATVQGAPDAPVSAAVVDMQGGQKGLFVNSTDICRGAHRADAAALAQNNRRHSAKAPLRNSRCKAKRKRHRSHRSR